MTGRGTEPGLTLTNSCEVDQTEARLVQHRADQLRAKPGLAYGRVVPDVANLGRDLVAVQRVVVRHEELVELGTPRLGREPQLEVGRAVEDDRHPPVQLHKEKGTVSTKILVLGQPVAPGR